MSLSNTVDSDRPSSTYSDLNTLIAKVRDRRPNSEIDTKAFWTSAPSFYALMYERSKSKVVCNLAFDDGRMAMLVSTLRYVPLAAARPRGNSGGLLLTDQRHENT